MKKKIFKRGEIKTVKEESNSKQKSVNNDKKSCFVITPIGDDGSPTRRHMDGIIDAVITPSLTDFNFNIISANRLPNPGSITKQIIQYIFESELVIANLTRNNPNVMYELAFRHCVGKPTIIIAEIGTNLPFDICDQRTFFYINDAQGVLELKDNLKQCVSSIDFSKEDIDNPIYNNLTNINNDSNILKKLESNPDDESDVLKYILEKINKIENFMTIQDYQRNVDQTNDNISISNSQIAEFMFEIIKDNSTVLDKCDINNLNNMIRTRTNQFGKLLSIPKTKLSPNKVGMQIFFRVQLNNANFGLEKVIETYINILQSYGFRIVNSESQIREI